MQNGLSILSYGGWRRKTAFPYSPTVKTIGRYINTVLTQQTSKAAFTVDLYGCFSNEGRLKKLHTAPLVIPAYVCFT